MPNLFNLPPHGSLKWGADRILRLLDREEQERRAGRPVESDAGAAVHVSRNAYSFGNEPASAPMPEDTQPTMPEDDYGWWDLGEDVYSDREKNYLEYVAANAAISEMVGSQLPGREAGPADAYRHILWAAEMTRRFGEARAREMLGLHEREGEIRGQQADDTAMDVSNNEIGIQTGIGARTFDDVMSVARKVISGSAADGLGAWKPEYDPTSTMAPHAAQWLPEERWALNPTEDAPPRSRVRFPPLPPRRLGTSETNWYSNPNLLDGPDWQGSYVPDGYVYPFGDVQHVTGQDDPAMLRARDAYRFLVRRPGLVRLKDRL